MFTWAEIPKRSVILAPLILVLLLMSIFYAQGGTGQESVVTAGEQILTSVIPNWIPTIGAALLIGYMIAGLGFMLSAVFRTPELAAWSKLELAEVTGTAFLITIILFAVVASDNIFKAATVSPEYPNGQTPLEVSSAFTSSLTMELLSIYFKSTSLGLALGTMAGMPVQIRHATDRGGGDISAFPPINKLYKKLQTDGGSGKGAATVSSLLFAIFFSSAWLQINTYTFYGLSVFQSLIYQVQSSMLTAIALAVVIDILNIFIKETVLPVMVPLGVLLRTFSFTRKLGATMIALAIGAYFFFPAGVLISKMMYDSAYKVGTDIPKISTPSLRIAGLAANPEKYTDLAEPLLNPPDLSFGACVEDLGGGIGGTLACAAAYLLWFILKILIWLIMVIIALIQLIIFTSIQLFKSLIGVVCPPCAFIFGYYINLEVMESVSLAMLNFIPYILQFSVPVYLTPLVILIVLVTGIRALSPVIGGEARILGVSQLV